MARPVYQGTNQYTQDLRRDLSRTQLFIRDGDFALSKDPAVYEKIRRDAVIAHAIQQRKHLVAGKEWYLESPDSMSKPLVSYFEDLLRRMRTFSRVRFNFAEAVFTGMRLGRLGGEFVDGAVVGPNPTPRRWWILTQVMDIDKRRVRREWREEEDGRRYFWTIFDPETDEWREITNPEHYAWHFYDDVEGQWYGRGLMNALYYYWYSKTHIMEYGLAGAERWAEGWVVAMIDGMLAGAPEAAIDTPGVQSHASRVTDWLKMLQQMREARVAVFDSRDTIDVKETSGSGHQIIKDFLAYLDDAIRVLILGSNLPTQATGGSFALAQVQENSTEALVSYDREILEETVTRDIIGALWRYNRPTFTAMGLGDLHPPIFRIRKERSQTPSDVNIALQGAQLAGIKLKEVEVYRRLGWTPPDEDDNAITLESPTPALPFNAASNFQDDPQQDKVNAFYKALDGRG